jgi:hypothetical protein
VVLPIRTVERKENMTANQLLYEVNEERTGFECFDEEDDDGIKNKDLYKLNTTQIEKIDLPQMKRPDSELLL